MKKILLGVFFGAALLLNGQARAQDAAIWPQTQTKTPQPANAQAFTPTLYKVTGETRNSTMYLLGSIHELTEANSTFPEVVLRNFDRADVAIFELPEEDLDADPLAMFRKLAPHMMLPGDDLLTNYVSTEEIQQLSKLLTDVPDTAMLKFRPWVVEMFLDLNDAKVAGMRAEHGIDLRLVKRGKSQGKKQIGLEQLDEQIGFLSSDPLDVQAKRLKKNLSDRRSKPNEAAEQTEKLLRNWVDGDVNELSNDFAKFREEDPVLFDRIGKQRNHNWLAKLKPHLAKPQTVFVTVGTLHLLGDNGLVKLLKDAGYKVERVER